MSRIEWNKAGERFFEAGVDFGVLYPPNNAPGVAWNGLVSVSENSSGGDLEPLYFDGVKYADIVANEDFSAQIESYGAPSEFDACDGRKQLVPGLIVTQQPRKTFGLCYRTLLGNDLVGTEYGYKLHLVYNCTAAPSGRTNTTIGANVTPGTRTWDINTVPPAASTFRPTAHIVLDSTLIEPGVMEQVELALYGRNAEDGRAAKAPYLPTVAELLLIMERPITALITATI